MPLDEVGHDQARRLAQAIGGRFDAVYASPLARARATAQALSEQVRTIAALAEVDQGSLEGLSGEEAMARYAEFFAAFAVDPTEVRVPGGETFGEVRDRAVEAITGLVREHEAGARLAVVTHQVVISTSLATFAGRPLTQWRSYNVPNTAVAIVAFDGTTPRIIEPRWTGGGPERPV